MSTAIITLTGELAYTILIYNDFSVCVCGTEILQSFGRVLIEGLYRFAFRPELKNIKHAAAINTQG